MNAPRDRHAWLIGASSGMGLEVGRLLATQGWAVTLSARDQGRLESAAGEIGAACRALDVTEPAMVADAAAELFANRPPTLVMVNAGDYEPMPIDDYDTALFARLNAVNYLGPVNVLGAVLPLMRDHGGGEILLNASAAGLRGLPRSAPYSAPKAATIHLAEALRPEAARWGIRLRVINPGFVRSRLTDKNRFTMPGLMDAPAAARRIVAGIGGSGFEISFPRRLIWPLQLLRCLPYGLYFRLVERGVLRS
jgi:NAD(P)-dependent dehydrogenase (short-subunit alcohol dehydrogenase family)